MTKGGKSSYKHEKNMNRKFVSKSNRVLRKVLNTEENIDIIQDFIESFLNVKITKIILNPYLEVKSNYLPSEENFGIADVRIQLENTEEYNIGIQFIDGYYAQNKMLLYYAQIHSNQLEYNDNRKITDTITINLLDFIYLKTDSYFSKIQIPSKNGKSMNLYVIELPKFKVDKQKLNNKKEAWMTYLCGEKQGNVEDILKKFEKIRKLDELLEQYWQREKME